MKAKIEGFIALDYASRFAEGRAYLTDLKSKGKLQYDYMVLEPKAGESGLGRCVEALGLLFDGKNYGKTCVSARLHAEPFPFAWLTGAWIGW